MVAVRPATQNIPCGHGARCPTRGSARCNTDGTRCFCRTLWPLVGARLRATRANGRGCGSVAVRPAPTRDGARGVFVGARLRATRANGRGCGSVAVGPATQNIPCGHGARCPTRGGACCSTGRGACDVWPMAIIEIRSCKVWRRFW